MRHYWLAVAIVLAYLLVAVIDLVTPTGLVIWVIQVPLICLSFFVLRPAFPLFLAVMSLALIGVGLIPLMSEPELWVILVRRGLAFATFVSVAFLVRQAIKTHLRTKQVEIQLEKALKDLSESNVQLKRSNEELEQFAGVAAHDLRSPIKALHSWVDMLDHSVPKPRNEGTDEAISFIRRNTRKADALIEDVLEIARVNPSETRTVPIDLNKTVRETLLTLEQQITAINAQVEVGDLPTVKGNASYLESVFSNLIRNAITYRAKTRRPVITIGCEPRRDEYQFFVKDNGIGIEPQHSSRIFEMFKRLHGDGEIPGTGIGLAFCKKVIDLCGGKIWVNSIPGEGSTFFFTYPVKFDGGNDRI